MQRVHLIINIIIFDLWAKTKALKAGLLDILNIGIQQKNEDGSIDMMKILQLKLDTVWAKKVLEVFDIARIEEKTGITYSLIKNLIYLLTYKKWSKLK